jgi:hypothetical protein
VICSSSYSHCKIRFMCVCVCVCVWVSDSRIIRVQHVALVGTKKEIM